MSTAIFHQMKLPTNERTVIRIISAATKTFCHHCYKNVTPNVIISKFLSSPLSICSICSSVIQYKKEKPHG